MLYRLLNLCSPIITKIYLVCFQIYLLPVIKSMGKKLEMPIVFIPTLAGPISNVLPFYFKALKSETHCRRP